MRKSNPENWNWEDGTPEDGPPVRVVSAKERAMTTNDQAIKYLREKKADLEKDLERAIEDLANEMEITASKFIGSAKMIRKYRRDPVDENLIEQKTMWVKGGIKNVNKICEKLEVLEALSWFEDEEEKA